MPHTSESLQQAFSYLFPNEVQALKTLAQSLPPNPYVLNIGSGSGTSSLALLESRSDLFLFCVDIEDKDSPLGSLYGERQVLEAAGFNGRYLQIHADSKVLGESWNEQIIEWGLSSIQLDMVFVDGLHTYNGAKGDIINWIPNIKPNGIMAVHDFEKGKVYQRQDLPDQVPHPLPWPGVDRAVRHYLCGKYEIVLHVDTLIAFKIK